MIKVQLIDHLIFFLLLPVDKNKRLTARAVDKILDNFINVVIENKEAWR